MKQNALRLLMLSFVVGFSSVAPADEQKSLDNDLSGMHLKTNMVDFLSYKGTIGLKAIEDKLVARGSSLLDVGFENMAWVMWQRDIVFPSNDADRAEWRWPANVTVESVAIDVQESDAFVLRKAGEVIASGDVKVFNTCREQLISFMHPHAKRFASSSAPLQFGLLVGLEVSHLGPETNMLYITERGSREDSLTYKNITLKIRYTDDSFAKHRKAIAEALMNAGAVLKSCMSDNPVSSQAADGKEIDCEKKKGLNEGVATRATK